MVVRVEAEFFEGRGRLARLPVQRAVGEPLEERGAVWEPRAHRGRRSILTWWWSSTTGRLVGCASLERQQVAVELDFDRQVVGFTHWPVRLWWSCGGEDRSLVADFVARTADGQRHVVVCPPAKPGPGWGATVTVLRDACTAAGWRLRLPGASTPVRAANLRRAAQYRHPRHQDDASEKALLEAFTRPRPLLEGVAATGLPAAPTLARAYHLVWAQRLSFDWEAPLLPTSVLAVAGTSR